MKATVAVLLTLMFSLPNSLAAQTRDGTMKVNPPAAHTPPQANDRAENLNETPESDSNVEEILKEAAGRPAMGLKDFEVWAEANNPTPKQANDLVLQSAAQARQAGLYPNPTVGYEGSEIRGGSFGGGEQGAFIQQNIVLGGKLGHRKHVFQEQQRMVEAGASEQHYRLLGDVDQRFYSALTAQEMVKLRRNLLNITLDAVETAHQLANVGQADEPDVLQTEVESDQARVEYRTAQMNYIAAFEVLAATAGKPGLPVSPLEGDLTNWPKLDPQKILETVLRGSPSVRRAQEAVARAEAQLQSAKREAIPDLHLRAGVQQDNEALNEAAARLKPAGVIGFASVGVDLPIFNRNQGNVAAAAAELSSAREELTRVRLLLQRRAEPLIRSYQALGNEASEYKNEMIPKAGRAYQLYLGKYQEMAAAYPEVLISQRELFRLRVSYVKALSQLWMDSIALQNFTLTNGLMAPAAAGSDSTNLNLPGAQPGAPGGE